MNRDGWFVCFTADGRVKDVESTMAAADQVMKETKADLVLFDPAAIYGRSHLASAVLHAQRAAAQGKQGAHTLSAEVLLYAAGERQVRHAIDRAGIRPGLEEVLVLALGEQAEAAA